MSSKQTILNDIKLNNCVQEVPLPNISDFGITFEDKFKQFEKSLQSVGGEALMCKKEQLDEVIKKLYPQAVIFASNTPSCTLSSLELEKVSQPHHLKDVEVAIVQGAFAIAENGAVWVSNEQNLHRALYFIAQNIVIIVNKHDIVNNMHEAFERIDYEEIDFGVFISGPSKTADIEQSLVIGAHGPKSGYVIVVE
jgi:L-lactate dehydrogenase complex protein LldG